MPAWIIALFKPVASIIARRQARKAAQQSAKNKLMQSKSDNFQVLELNKDEWEQLQVKGMDTTWKDEYVTVSVVSILNIIVGGGLLSAFGYPQVLTGIGTAIQAITTAGVDIGFLLEATILAAIGLSVWKRV